MKLKIHAALEDSLLYPLLEKCCAKKVALESLKSMNEVMKLISELRKINEEDPEFNRVFDGMVQDFELHRQEAQAEIALLAQARVPDCAARSGSEPLFGSPKVQIGLAW